MLRIEGIQTDCDIYFAEIENDIVVSEYRSLGYWPRDTIYTWKINSLNWRPISRRIHQAKIALILLRNRQATV